MQISLGISAAERGRRRLAQQQPSMAAAATAAVEASSGGGDHHQLRQRDGAPRSEACLVTLGDWCRQYKRQVPLQYKLAPRGSKRCLNNCNGVGNCNYDIGVCDCPAGSLGHESGWCIRIRGIPPSDPDLYDLACDFRQMCVQWHQIVQHYYGDRGIDTGWLSHAGPARTAPLDTAAMKPPLLPSLLQVGPAMTAPRCSCGPVPIQTVKLGMSRWWVRGVAYGLEFQASIGPGSARPSFVSGSLLPTGIVSEWGHPGLSTGDVSRVGPSHRKRRKVIGLEPTTAVKPHIPGLTPNSI